jgi:hypothetical protein
MFSITRIVVHVRASGEPQSRAAAGGQRHLRSERSGTATQVW